MFEHAALRSWLKLGALLSGLAACLGAIATGSLWLVVSMVPIAAVCATSAAMMGHEGSHRSLSASRTRNSLM